MKTRNLRLKLRALATYLLLGIFVLTTLTAGAAPAYAQDTTPRRAFIFSMEGSVLVQATGQSTALPARRNMELKSGDRIITGRDGTVEIRYDDGSISRIGPGSRVDISNLSRQGADGAETTVLSTQRGSIWNNAREVVQRNSRFEVNTPAAVAGVRGTNFLVRVQSAADTLVRVYQGLVGLAPAPDEAPEEVIDDDDVPPPPPPPPPSPEQEMSINPFQQASLSTDVPPSEPAPVDPLDVDDFEKDSLVEDQPEAYVEVGTQAATILAEMTTERLNQEIMNIAQLEREQQRLLEQIQAETDPDRIGELEALQQNLAFELETRGDIARDLQLDREDYSRQKEQLEEIRAQAEVLTPEEIRGRAQQTRQEERQQTAERTVREAERTVRETTAAETRQQTETQAEAAGVRETLQQAREEVTPEDIERTTSAVEERAREARPEPEPAPEPEEEDEDEDTAEPPSLAPAPGPAPDPDLFISQTENITYLELSLVDIETVTSNNTDVLTVVDSPDESRIEITSEAEGSTTISAIGETFGNESIVAVTVAADGSMTLDITAPPVNPKNLTASPGDTIVELSWDASLGADSYDIYRAEGASPSEEDFIQIATEVTETTYTATGLTNGTQYWFAVVAVNASGPSYATVLSATPTALVVPEYTVTFDEDNDLYDVSIQVYSDEELTVAVGDPVTTAEGGVATKDLADGNYWFTANLVDYQNFIGNFEVAEVAKQIDFEMVAVGPEASGSVIIQEPVTEEDTAIRVDFFFENTGGGNAYIVLYNDTEGVVLDNGTMDTPPPVDEYWTWSATEIKPDDLNAGDNITATLYDGGMEGNTETNELDSHTVIVEAVVSETGTAEVSDAGDLLYAITNSAINLIIFTEDIKADINANRLVNIDFGAHTMTGSAIFNTTEGSIITLSGSAISSITGDLTVNTPEASVYNNVSVGGTVYIEDIAAGGDPVNGGGNVLTNTWYENAPANTLELKDEGLKVLVLREKVSEVAITVTGGALGFIGVESDATVSRIDISENSEGLIIMASGAHVDTIIGDGATMLMMQEGASAGAVSLNKNTDNPNNFETGIIVMPVVMPGDEDFAEIEKLQIGANYSLISFGEPGSNGNDVVNLKVGEIDLKGNSILLEGNGKLVGANAGSAISSTGVSPGGISLGLSESGGSGPNIYLENLIFENVETMASKGVFTFKGTWFEKDAELRMGADDESDNIEITFTGGGWDAGATIAVNQNTKLTFEKSLNEDKVQNDSAINIDQVASYPETKITGNENLQNPLAISATNFTTDTFDIIQSNFTQYFSAGQSVTVGAIGVEGNTAEYSFKVIERPDAAGDAHLEFTYQASAPPTGTVTVAAINNTGNAEGTWKVKITNLVSDAHTYIWVPVDAGGNVTMVSNYNVGDVGFSMRLAPAATFPTGINDDGTASVVDDFWIAETQATYELWYAVRVWAEANGYHFQNVGREGHNGTIGAAPTTERKTEPVTTVSWRDAVIWLNALSEMDGKTPVYWTEETDGEILRDSRTTINGTPYEVGDHPVDNSYQINNNNGFRLPAFYEWELAARWIGTTDPGLEGQYGHGQPLATERKTTTVDGITYYWTPGKYASGATAAYNITSTTIPTSAVAWYSANSSSKTQPVGQKTPNPLGIHDMSGNVWEPCFDQVPGGSNRRGKGGAWADLGDWSQVGLVTNGSLPTHIDIHLGFRLARTPVPESINAVLEEIPVAAVAMNNVAPGTTTTVAITVTGSSISVASSNEAVATVTVNAINNPSYGAAATVTITAIGTGTSTITVTAQGINGGASTSDTFDVNVTLAAVAPVVVSAITNTTGDTITIEFDKEMEDPSDSVGQFSFDEDGTTKTFHPAALDATDHKKINLTVDGDPITQGAIVTVSYTADPMMLLMATDGSVLESFTDEPVSNIVFAMQSVPSGTFTIPTGTDDSGTAEVAGGFEIAETQVTYELWYEVRMWALDNGYSFRVGREGSSGNTGEEPTGRKNEPVTTVNWYDSIVWCNALSQMLGYDPVYTIGGEIIRSATGIAHTDVVAENRNGFRLPTSYEWELAARYKGSDSSSGAIEYPAESGNYWTPGNYASGATADYNNEVATKAAAWYGAFNDSGNTTKTQDVGQKPSGGNGLGVFDMSGNVGEWCFTKSGTHRVTRGGSWYSTAQNVQVSASYNLGPGSDSSNYGFRFVRTSLIPIDAVLEGIPMGPVAMDDVAPGTTTTVAIAVTGSAISVASNNEAVATVTVSAINNPSYGAAATITITAIGTGTSTITVTAQGINGGNDATDTFNVNLTNITLPAFTMIPVGTAGTTYTFPTGTDDSTTGSAVGGYLMAETQVTYELWYAVRVWATHADRGADAYTFANAGREGSHGNTGQAPSASKNEPVTTVSWYDSIVWCNALSEMLGYDPVYTIGGVIIRSATGIAHTNVVAENRNGFRLPASMEWELAARWIGTTAPTIEPLATERKTTTVGGITYYWTPGNYASGATANYNNAAATQAAAWYLENSDVDDSGRKTQDVGQKPSSGNGLVVFDMSGNVWEWCFNQSASGLYRDRRGGSWSLYASSLPVGHVGSYLPNDASNHYGLRFLRTPVVTESIDAVLDGIPVTTLAMDSVTAGTTTTVAITVTGSSISVASSNTSAAAVTVSAINNPSYGAAATITITAIGTGTSTITVTAQGINGGNDATDTFNVNLTNITLPAFTMIPVGTAGTTYTFPIGIDDSTTGSAVGGYLIAGTQVTYELWYNVRQWALLNGYHFQNVGREGSVNTNDGGPPTAAKNEPVTMVSWRDTVVWLNALSEMEGKEPVYRTSGGNIIRDSRNDNAAEVDAAVQTANNGFRLPTSMEWEMAARWKNDTQSTDGSIEIGGRLWTPGNYASGATAPNTDAPATGAVAWYTENSSKTQPVSQKLPNVLGLYDISGNVWEWCFDLFSGNDRVRRGGGWNGTSSVLQVGHVGGYGSGWTDTQIGFRLVGTP